MAGGVAARAVTITVAAGGVASIGEERLYIVVPGTGKNDPP